MLGTGYHNTSSNWKITEYILLAQMMTYLWWLPRWRFH